MSPAAKARRAPAWSIPMPSPDDPRRRQTLPNTGGGWSRRGVLLGVGAAGMLSACAPKAGGAAGGAKTLKVSAYGGNFERAMSAHIYPLFEQKTGIKVLSQPQ